MNTIRFRYYVSCKKCQSVSDSSNKLLYKYDVNARITEFLSLGVCSWNCPRTHPKHPHNQQKFPTVPLTPHYPHLHQNKIFVLGGLNSKLTYYNIQQVNAKNSCIKSWKPSLCKIVWYKNLTFLVVLFIRKHIEVH